MNIQGGNGQLNLACTCVPICTRGDMPSKAASQLSLASLISHLPQTLRGRAGSCGFCYAFVLSNLICFVFCCVPLERVKDAPTLWLDCTPLCPDSHGAAWEAETLSPCPLPPLERKKQKQKQKNAQTELGLFTSPGWSQAWRGFPPFLGLCDV